MFAGSSDQLMDTAHSSALVISWASTNTAQIQTQDSNEEYFEGFVHASTLIRLGSLRRALPDKHTTDAGEIVEETFEEVHPGPGKDYMYHPGPYNQDIFCTKRRWIRLLQTKER